MDKYYMLVRKFVYASFALLMRNQWDEDILAKMNEMLTSTGAPLWYAFSPCLILQTPIL